MSTIEILKARANSAWAADDGQMPEESVAISVARVAAREGLIQVGNVELAAKVLAEHLQQSNTARGAVEKLPAMEAARRNAESEWQAAVDAAKRPVLVHDEDGGTSVEMRVPTGWTHEGCASLAEYLRKTVAGYAEAESAKAQTADDEAAKFVAALPSMTAEQAKQAYWALSNAARLSSHIRALPKAVRRQF